MQPQNPYKVFHLWITVLMKSYEQAIILKLVAKGYSVSPAGGSVISTQTKDGVGAVVALRVEKYQTTHDEIMKDTQVILAAVDAKYFSIVISEFTLNCTWASGNIVAAAKLAEPDDTKPQNKQTN